MHDDENDILQETDKGVLKAQGVLAGLFRRILFDTNVTPYSWNMKMAKYLDDPSNGVAQNGHARSSTRGNLNKQLRRPTMSWKTFRKGIKFLAPIKAKFTVELEWESKRITTHSIVLASSSTDETYDETGDETE